MSLGNAKDSWPIWLVLVVAIVVIIFVFKKPAEKEMQTAMPEKVLSPAAQAMIDASQEIPKGQSNLTENGPVIHAHPKTTKNNGIFSIQIYSFQDEGRASTALQTIKDRGYEDVHLLVSDLGEKGIWHRVRVGYFDQEEEAKAVLEKLRSDFNSGIIVRN